MKKLIALLLLAIFIPAQLMAWGPKGHAIVADIATSRLTLLTKQNLQLLLGGDSLASVASWADAVRKDRDESYDWHFVDIPKDAPGFSEERDCFRPQDKHKDALTDHHNCVVDRIESFQKILGDEKASSGDRLEALKWIVHFVGDLHQPLHAIDEARGGNDIKLAVFGSPKCGDHDCNLHWTWDTLLLEHTGYSEEEYVGRLNMLIAQKHLEKQAGGTPVDWANESHLQARHIIEAKPAVIDEAYYQANIELLNERLALAGLRLATLLNNTLGKAPAAKVSDTAQRPADAQHKKAFPKAEELPTGMSITPLTARGSTLQALNPGLPDLPDFTVDHPISTAVSPDGNTLLILTSGYNRNNDAKGKAIPAQTSEYIFVFDIQQAKPVQHQVLRIPNAYVGIAWAPDGTHFYVGGGQDDNIHVFAQDGGHWSESEKPIALGHKTGLGIPDREETKIASLHPMVAGVAVSPNGKQLLVANHQNDSVSLIDLAAKQVITELDLRPGKINPAQKGVAGGEYPYGVVFASDDKAYVSSLRDREIVALAVKPELTVSGRIKTHGQPGKLIVNRSGALLFAAADNSDSIVIVETTKDSVVAEIKTTAPAALLTNRSNFKGSNPNSLALAPDEKTLYVTNGGTNSVAVIAVDKDPDDSRTVGLIPTAWYPTSVSVSKNGATLFIVNGKSMPGPNPQACRKTFTTVSDDRPCAATGQYILQLEKGGFAVVPRPDAAELRELTQQVARNNHFAAPADDPKSRQLFAFLHQHIKHVIYIVKENRSYDQVLGDLEKGNGDPSLTLFPEAMTPNHHELARQFVTLDNFFDSGEVSGVGWNWSTSARTTDEVERSIPLNYAFRGMTYDAEGSNRNINVGLDSAHDRNTEKLDDAENQLPGHADVAAPDGPEDESGAGYLWDGALRSGLSLRNYGFFIDLSHYSTIPGAEPPIPLLHDPAASGTRVATATKANLQQVTDPYFRGFDQRFPDYWRYKEWEREFDEYVAHDNLPNLELVRLPHDHLGSFNEAVDGVNTVETEIADNDYAVGLLLEKVAHSKYGKDTLIFVIEDDAQNGPDHVDAHRSLALVAGPYVKQRAVISKRFNTVTFLRTMEEVLGIKPLGLNDALQPPMTEIFSAEQAVWTYKARVPSILRTTKLPLPGAITEEKTGAANLIPGHDSAYWADKTKGFDFSAEDKLDSESFNMVLWTGLKGDGHPYPTERYGRDLSKHRDALLRDLRKSKH